MSSIGNAKIAKLARGMAGSALNIKEGEVRYFTFKHVSGKGFKIISLHLYGHLKMYLNKSSPKGISEMLSKQEALNYDWF